VSNRAAKASHALLNVLVVVMRKAQPNAVPVEALRGEDLARREGHAERLLALLQEGAGVLSHTHTLPNYAEALDTAARRMRASRK